MEWTEGGWSRGLQGRVWVCLALLPPPPTREIQGLVQRAQAWELAGWGPGRAEGWSLWSGEPHPLWRGRNQPAGGLSTHASSGEDGGGNEVKALSYLPGPWLGGGGGRGRPGKLRAAGERRKQVWWGCGVSTRPRTRAWTRGWSEEVQEGPQTDWPRAEHVWQIPKYPSSVVPSAGRSVGITGSPSGLRIRTCI